MPVQQENARERADRCSERGRKKQRWFFLPFSSSLVCWRRRRHRSFATRGPLLSSTALRLRLAATRVRPCERAEREKRSERGRERRSRENDEEGGRTRSRRAEKRLAFPPLVRPRCRSTSSCSSVLSLFPLCMSDLDLQPQLGGFGTVFACEHRNAASVGQRERRKSPPKRG